MKKLIITITDDGSKTANIKLKFEPKLDMKDDSKNSQIILHYATKILEILKQDGEMSIKKGETA